MKIEVSASEIKSEKKADDRGRVTLGSEFAGKTVTVAVLDVDLEEPPAGAPMRLSCFVRTSTSTLKNHRSDTALSLAGVTSRKRGTEVRPLPLTTTRRVLIKKTVVLPRDASIRQEHRSDY